MDALLRFLDFRFSSWIYAKCLNMSVCLSFLKMWRDWSSLASVSIRLTAISHAVAVSAAGTRVSVQLLKEDIG